MGADPSESNRPLSDPSSSWQRDLAPSADRQARWQDQSIYRPDPKSRACRGFPGPWAWTKKTGLIYFLFSGETLPPASRIMTLLRPLPSSFAINAPAKPEPTIATSHNILSISPTMIYLPQEFPRRSHEIGAR